MDDATRGRIIALPLIAFALILADQVSKDFARESARHHFNPGISWGLFKNIANINEIMIIVATLALLLFIYLIAFHEHEFHSYAGLLLLISGAAGNLIDRIIHGGVIDFIAIGTFPVFNFADAYLTIGVVIILVSTAIFELKTKGWRILPRFRRTKPSEGTAPYQS